MRLLFLIVLYLPILFLPLFSFNASIYVRFPLEGFTTQWYRQLFQRHALWAALRNSLYVALTVADHHRAGGDGGAGDHPLPAARAKRHRHLHHDAAGGAGHHPWRGAAGADQPAGRAPVALYRHAWPSDRLPALLGGTLLPRFEGFDRSMEEASADLGEPPWSTFWRVTFPIVFPGVVASLLLTFTISFDEFIMAFFLSGTDPTLPMYIWSQLRFPREFPSVLALSSMICSWSRSMLVFLALWIGRLGAVEPGRNGRSGMTALTPDLGPQCREIFRPLPRDRGSVAGHRTG
jgi:spermidine/putrescine transport system permease protein